LYTPSALALAWALILTLLCVNADAQPQKPVEPTTNQLKIQIDILKTRLKQSQDTIEQLQQKNGQDTIESLLLKAYMETQKDYYELQDKLQRKQAEYNSAVFEWNTRSLEKQAEYNTAILSWNARSLDGQRMAYNVILSLVGLVVIAGTVFSGFQLWKSSMMGLQTTNNLEMSATRIRVTSSVVGLIVLVISLGFLYIYTKEVYQVRVLDAGGVLSAGKSSP
jgi:hypothetical protein